MNAETIDKILAPIASAPPAGVNVDLSPSDLTIRRIEELRREEDARTSFSGNAKEADWKRVVRDCEEALASHSKHLDILRYLTEGLVHTEGSPGLALGFRLARELLERYWDNLYPGLENGQLDLEVRARPLSWMGTAADFIGAVRQIPWAPGQPNMSWSAYQSAVQNKTAEEWRKSLDALPRSTLDTALAGIESSRTELDHLQALCTQKFGDACPEFGPIGSVLDEQLAFLRSRPKSSSTTATQAADGDATSRAAPPQAGPIQSREQALQWLEAAAEYLARTEPHSPVPHLVQRAVRWARMSFEDLMQDIIKKDDVRTQMWDVLGLSKRDKPSG